MILLGLGIISSISSIGYTIYNCSNIYNKKNLLTNANLFTDYENINKYDIELNKLDDIEETLDKN